MIIEKYVKRYYLIILMCIFALFCGCKTDEAAQKVMDDINSIGEVTREDKELIEKIEATYITLTDKQKKQVKNYVDLLKARDLLDIALAEVSLTPEEEIAYNCAVQLKNALNDPDSFKLYDNVFLMIPEDENRNPKYTYTILEYGGANGYGGIVKKTAIFKNGQYLCDYEDEIEETEENREKLLGRIYLKIYMTFGTIQGQIVNIDSKTLREKMGIE